MDKGEIMKCCLGDTVVFKFNGHYLIGECVGKSNPCNYNEKSHIAIKVRDDYVMFNNISNDNIISIVDKNEAK